MIEKWLTMRRRDRQLIELCYRQSMEAMVTKEILDAIEAAGYANGGRVGYALVT
jgi:hypothetical protein